MCGLHGEGDDPWLYNLDLLVYVNFKATHTCARAAAYREVRGQPQVPSLETLSPSFETVFLIGIWGSPIRLLPPREQMLNVMYF